MYRLRFQSYKVLTNVGTFFYHKRNNESLFFPLDSFLFFKSLEEGANKKQLISVLENEYELTESECIQITQDTLDSLSKYNLIETLPLAPQPN
jgi:hypothetical protein